MIRNANSMDIDMLSTIIISKIKNELVSKIAYDLNIPLGNYKASKLKVLIEKLKAKAKEENIEINIDVDNLLLLAKELNIHANYIDDMFLKFMIMEKHFYNSINNNNNIIMNFESLNMGRLYTLHALQTAYYQAGIDEFYIKLNDKNYKLKSHNMSSKYYNKIITMEEAKYSKQIEEQREENKKRNLVKKR